jgi:L-ascorbate metabolism protein UlaG (beta-lactamase superfamily)
MRMRLLILTCAALASLTAGAASAQEINSERRPSHCIAYVENTPGVEVIRVASDAAPLPVGFGDALAPETIRISYLDHAMFLIETPGRLTVVTDYNGFIGPTDFAPDVVTMNHAHGTHWTASPDPRIAHVLPGWNTEGDGPVVHRLDLGEMLVRNVTTDIRGRFGGPREADGNSIFIFEVGGLCIGHLGHLHHEPTPEQYAAIGRLDVVMAPVDGGMTLPLPDMIAILKRVRAAIVIPSHWFSTGSLRAFVAGMEDRFRVDIRSERGIEVSLMTLPREPTIVVLPPLMLGLEDR